MMQPRLRFREFTAEWCVQNTESLLGAKLSNGATVSPSAFSKSVTGKRIVQIDSLFASDLTLDTSELQYLLEDTRGRSLQDNDILVNRVSIKPSGVGKVVIVESIPIGDTFVYESNMFRLRFDNKEVVPKFYAYFGSTDSYRKQKLRFARVGNQASLSQNDISKIKISLGSIAEQLKIVDYLTELDKKIALIDKKVELLEQYKKGVMQKIFTQQIRFDSGRSYQAWWGKELGELVKFYRGNLLSKSDLTKDGKYKAVHYGELFTEYGEVIETIRSKTDRDSGSYSRAGDLLMPASDVTPLGLARATVIQENNVMIGGDINVLRPKDGVNSIFFSYLMNWQKRKIMRLVTGSTVRHVYNKDIARIVYWMPKSVEEQKEIAGFLMAISVRIKAEENRLDMTKKFKRALLQRIFI